MRNHSSKSKLESNQERIRCQSRTFNACSHRHTWAHTNTHPHPKPPHSWYSLQLIGGKTRLGFKLFLSACPCVGLRLSVLIITVHNSSTMSGSNQEREGITSQWIKAHNQWSPLFSKHLFSDKTLVSKWRKNIAWAYEKYSKEVRILRLFISENPILF